MVPASGVSIEVLPLTSVLAMLTSVGRLVLAAVFASWSRPWSTRSTPKVSWAASRSWYSASSSMPSASKSRLRPVHLAGVARIVVTTEPDSAPRHHLQRFDEVRHKAGELIHPLTMPRRFVATPLVFCNQAGRQEKTAVSVTAGTPAMLRDRAAAVFQATTRAAGRRRRRICTRTSGAGTALSTRSGGRTWTSGGPWRSSRSCSRRSGRPAWSRTSCSGRARTSLTFPGRSGGTARSRRPRQRCRYRRPGSPHRCMPWRCSGSGS